jgi:hypothetical protein
VDLAIYCKIALEKPKVTYVQYGSIINEIKCNEK